MKTSLAAIGSYTPEKILTNADFEKMVDTSDEWIRTRSGIRERHIAADDQATSDLSVIASKRALEAAHLSPKHVQAIIVATATPDMLFPSTACLVQTRIGAPHVISFDISAGCTGFLYGLAIAESLVKSGYDNILVIGADTLSKITDYTDRTTCVLFGDGAGAALIKRTELEDCILSSYFAADGSSWQLLQQPGGGSRIPASHDSVDKRLHYIKMQGNEVFKLAVRAMSEAALKTLKKASISTSQIDLLIPHQANIRIIEASAKRLHIPAEKVLVNLDRYGNTSAASIPIALDQAIREGRAKKGDLILMIAFGAGFTWGGVLLRY
ncbi:3-oxoacyl-ACP synthase [candidate division WOR_3 bacterium SM23_42]|uniref:Beta-ketoacyl-[acyl-carrier-protein] synthase III n=1 Tax=candidate division WOR_3 bacterium SM23_42 TaxID=1703779 RepID=A0A0S8FU08_UNCW3|nr:MAG: 3-oxoacyl-ACP synthase [candidate division WOR_3 bacterium SM23_42]